MDEKVPSWLETLNKKLDKLDKLDLIEDQISKQNDRIKSIEEQLKKESGNNDVNKTLGDEKGALSETQSRNENFINQMKAELGMNDQGKKEFDGTKPKIKKAISLREKSTQKPRRVKRTTHTVPSDKDEERRLNSFRRECLSKAIQWNIVDILKATSEGKIIIFPNWLSGDEMKQIERAGNRKNHLRIFLYILICKDFVTMQEWLRSCSLQEKVVKGVWKTFEEFSDIETNRSRMKCFHCRLVETVNVMDVVDYLFSAEIISSELCYQISCSELIVGAQGVLWKRILEECRRYIRPEALVTALKIAFTDRLSSSDEEEKGSYESLLKLMDQTDTQELLTCGCKERCSKSFHPISCLKTMSLANVYFSPPTRRKREISSTSSGSPQSSLSSLETVVEESRRQMEVPSSPDEETDLKKPEVPPRVPLENGRTDMKANILKIPDKPHRNSAKMSHRKSKHTDLVLPESSSDSLDGDEKPVVPSRNCIHSATSISSQRLENKPNVIRANTVYLNTGHKYIRIVKGRASSYSSESSSAC